MRGGGRQARPDAPAAGILGAVPSGDPAGGLIPAPPPAAREPYRWPVPGDGAAAIKDALGHNGLRFSDGRYSPAGEFRNRPHYGIDLPAKHGDAVEAAGPGTVYRSGRADGWGNYIAIRHDDGRIGVYAHLSGFEPLKPGERVAAGQKIASVGETGNAKGKGTHLHLEVREDFGARSLRRIRDGAVAIDPVKWINGALR
jgi:murein DD-endopeptidase MepM/ murein hydrolase activator NlpD